MGGNALKGFVERKNKLSLLYYEQKISDLIDLLNQQIVKNLNTLHEKCDIISLKLQLKLNVLNATSDFITPCRKTTDFRRWI